VVVVRLEIESVRLEIDVLKLEKAQLEDDDDESYEQYGS